MWVRGIIGRLLCLAGVVWILRGANVFHGSLMSAQGGYAVLDVVALVLGLSALTWAWRRSGVHG